MAPDPSPSPGLHGAAAGGWVLLIAAPSFSRTGRSGHLPLSLLYILGSRGVAGAKRASFARGGRVFNLAPRRRAILGVGEEIPMSQIAPAVGTAPARRLRRPVAGSCGSIEFIPGTLRRAWDGSLARTAHTARVNLRSGRWDPQAATSLDLAGVIGCPPTRRSLASGATTIRSSTGSKGIVITSTIAVSSSSRSTTPPLDPACSVILPVRAGHPSVRPVGAAVSVRRAIQQGRCRDASLCGDRAPAPNETKGSSSR
jgi:hypothetical protein